MAISYNLHFQQSLTFYVPATESHFYKTDIASQEQIIQYLAAKSRQFNSDNTTNYNAIYQ